MTPAPGGGEGVRGEALERLARIASLAECDHSPNLDYSCRRCRDAARRLLATVTHPDNRALLLEAIGERFEQPKRDGEPCPACDWDGEGDQPEHDHADFAGHFATFDEWQAHPSHALAQAVNDTNSAIAGQSDWDSCAYDQEQAERWIEAMQETGWRFVYVFPEGEGR